MAAKLLDGHALSAKLSECLRVRAADLALQGCRPGLAVLLVGGDAAAQRFLGNKRKASESVGVHFEKHEFPADAKPGQVFQRLAALNADPHIHGILVQLPLPSTYDEDAVLAAISPDKDVDGVHTENLGALMQGQPRFIPCAHYGVLQLLKSANVNLRGAEAVIVGRSNIVGKPMALLLLDAGATVTICHSQTGDLAFHTRRADILVAAAGRAKMIDGAMIKPGATVIDFGMNRQTDGRLCGDVDFESAREVAGLITPMPGGVGPMTITMLLTNAIEAAERSIGR